MALFIMMISVSVGSAVPASGVNLENDPKGFGDIPWGASLADRSDLIQIASDGRIVEYERKEGPLPLGEAQVSFMRLLAINGKFARVTVRYEGKATHNKILTFLQSRFGGLERVPGQMVRGLNQQYTWRGTDTEIDLTYHEQGERGYLFFDSRVLAPRFNDKITDSNE